MKNTIPHSPLPPLSKRPCNLNHSSPKISRVLNSNQMDHVLEQFLGFSEDSTTSIDLSLERLLESRISDSDQNQMIENALKLGSFLLESGKKFQRKRFTKHNSITWFLPSELTVKVFSMLDTQSLCFAAATCSMFNKCAMEPVCYSNIDLTSAVPKVNNLVVFTMIQRAGTNLQSLKLGILPSPRTLPVPSHPKVYENKNLVHTAWNDKRSRQGKESCMLTRSCLMSLSMNGGASGALLKRLHLYNIDRMEDTALCAALSSCGSLLVLEIIGLHVELWRILESLSSNCHDIEHLFIESSQTGTYDSLKSSTCVGFVNGCPHLTSLALRGFSLQDYKVRVLVKGLSKLKSVDLSASYSITGTFLRNLGSCRSGHALEVLLLRDCLHLKEIEVGRLLEAILAEGFKKLKYLDISNKEGLASAGDWYDRCYSPCAIPIKRVMQERPEICLLADFPKKASNIDIEWMLESEVNFPLNISVSSSDSSSFSSSSESSDSSDQGSGNEDGLEGVSYLLDVISD